MQVNCARAMREAFGSASTALRVDQADIRSELKLVKWMSATSVACVLMLLVRSFL